MPKFNVTLSRTRYENVQIEVEADDRHAAESVAERKGESLDEDDWTPSGETEGCYASDVEEVE